MYKSFPTSFRNLEVILAALLFQPVCGIIHKLPPGRISSSQSQQIGIITGPDPTSNWVPASQINLNYFLNQECKLDDDCFPSRTLLYCVSYKCQCITNGATYINHFFYNYNMIWNEHLSQCTSQTGSPCTLQRYWYSPDILKMECVQGHECVEIDSQTAKATIAAQTPTSYGSSVSVSNNNWNPHAIQYFGSGVTNFGGSSGHSQRGDYDISAGNLNSPTVAATSTTNTWGICVKRRFAAYNPSAFQEAEINRNSGACKYVPITFVILSSVFYLCTSLHVY